MKLITQLFLPVLPISIMTNLERMVATRAISSSVISNLSSEISIENMIIDIMNCRPNNLWIVSILTIYLYGMYQYNEGLKNKLVKVKIFGKYSRIIRELSVIFFLVFTRDIQNAI